MLTEIKVEACVGHNLFKVDIALALVLQVLTAFISQDATTNT